MIKDEIRDSDELIEQLACSTLSGRLRVAMGSEENASQHLICSADLLNAIDAIIDALYSEAKKLQLNLNIKDAHLVTCLYYRLYHEDFNDDLKKESKRATIVCIVQYLNWCKELLQRHSLERRLLIEFDIDMFQSGILGANYKEGYAVRTYTTNTFMQYADILCMFTGRSLPQPLARDMFSLFGIRQTLEIRFRRLLGLRWIDPMPKIGHEVIPTILKKHEKAFRYKNGNKLKISDVMHIYNWTDYSIHSMSSNYIWLVWKAIVSSSDFLTPPKFDEKSKYMHINASMEMDECTLQDLRNDFRKWVIANKFGKDVKIYWEEPEVPIVDERGELKKIGSFVETL